MQLVKKVRQVGALFIGRRRAFGSEFPEVHEGMSCEVHII